MQARAMAEVNETAAVDLYAALGQEHREHPTMQALVHIGRDHLQRCLPMSERAALPAVRPDKLELGGNALADSPPMAAMELLRREVNIPALPELMLQLFSVISSSRCSFGNVTRVVRMDTGLTAAVLKVANSAAVGMQTPVSDLKQAVSLIGMDEITAMAMSTTYLKHFKPHPDAHMDLRQFWKHSFCTGITAKNLARGLGLANCERYFVAGLLHDIGRLALYANLPGFAGAVENYCMQTGMSQQEVEQEACGFDHAAFGATLLYSWNLPQGIVELVQRHHEPAQAVRERAEVVYAADVLSTLMGHGPSLVPALPELSPAPWDALGVSSPLLYSLMEDIAPSLERSFSILGGMGKYLQ